MQAIANGCHLCTYLYKFHSLAYRHKIHSLRFRFTSLSQPSETYWHTYLEVIQQEQGYGPDLTPCWLPVVDSYNYYLEKEELSLSTGSDTCLALAKDWMATCLRDHPRCAATSASTAVLPSRLLDLGDRDSSIVRITNIAELHLDTSSTRHNTRFSVIDGQRHPYSASRRRIRTCCNRVSMTRYFRPPSGMPYISLGCCDYGTFG